MAKIDTYTSIKMIKLSENNFTNLIFFSKEKKGVQIEEKEFSMFIKIQSTKWNICKSILFNIIMKKKKKKMDGKKILIISDEEKKGKRY